VLHQLLGSSNAIAAVRVELTRLLARPAVTPKRLPPVLIQGETGTGKGLVAHLIHEMGPRADAAFVDVNCAAIPDTLLEAELFGYERGAFTDARQAKAGLLQVAHRGTIFLDEIGLMPEGLQAKLLKALEDRSVRRLGSTRAEPADAWVLAATSENLSEAIAVRRFREDLYHRLAVVIVQLPPLRERGDDVLLLARHYLNKACGEYGLPSKDLTADAELALLAYPWPGNVREVANVMERVALLADGSQVTATALRLPHAPRTIGPAVRSGGSVDDQMAALERVRIEEALRIEGWNISRAAARLGLPRNTLRYRIERHGLAEADDSSKRRRKLDTAPASAPSSGVQWQRTRVTLLHAQVLETDPPVAEHERERALEQLGAKASGFGGRILDLGPSSVRVAFGLDASEDAAHHAAHAALAMQRLVSGASISRPLPVRIALHTDELLVGRLDDRIELDADARRTAQGVLEDLQRETVEGILASPATKALIERRFDVEPTPLSAGDQPSWRVMGLVETDRHSTPFVSRDREIAMLDDLLAQVEEGRGHAVLLAGDPGMGKSRLLHEFRRRTKGRASWMQGSAVSFGKTLPFHPLIDLLKNAFSIQADDSDPVVVERITYATAGFSEAFRPSVQFLRALLSVESGSTAITPLDPKLRRAGIFDAVRQLFLETAAARPLVVVLEDLHWMDPATGEFLAMMIESLVSGRILLCVTHRTGYALPVAPGVFDAQLVLSRVSQAGTETIGRSLLGASALSAELQRLVEVKTEGNPFFVEEVLRSLDERGLLVRHGDAIGLPGPTGKIEIPNRVHDVILGRLDRLDPAAREVLHVAAVIGREFPRRVLERVLPDAHATIEDRLQQLRAADLIHNARVWPDVIYVFKHALTHEVAYDAQGESPRSAQHARIGDAIEVVYADRLSEHFGVLAHHFTRAQRWDKALEYLLAAAQQAERTFATREALGLYDEARRAAEHLAGGVGDPITLIGIHEAKARLYFVTSDFERSAQEGERILPLARLIGNRAKEAEAHVTIAWASTWGRNLEAAIRSAREALAVAEPAHALAAQGRAHFTIGFVRGVTGVLDESGASLETAVQMSTAAGDAVNRSLSLAAAGLLRNWAGEYSEAARLQHDSESLARECGVLFPLLFSCFLRGLTLTGKGDYDEAFASFTEGLSLAQRVGDEAIHHRLLNCLGWLYADLGDLDHAEELNAISAQIGRRRRDPGTQPNAELNLGDIFRARGDLVGAQEQYDSVFKYWRNPSTSQWMKYRYSIRMFASMGELALARNDLSVARSHAAECLELATRTGSRKNLVKAHRLGGQIACAERDWDHAEDHFRASRELATSLGNPPQLWKAELAFGDFLRNAGRVDESRQAYARSFAIMQQARSGLRHDKLRDAFEKNPDMRTVRDLLAHA